MTEMIEIRADSQQLREVMTRLARTARDRTPLMRLIAGIMADAVEENFDQEGRPKWKSLAPATTRNRARTGNWPGKILTRSGALAASITRAYDNDHAVVGTNKVYAAIQHLGGQAGRGHKVTIPARPFLKLDKQDEEKIVRRAGDYLTKGL